MTHHLYACPTRPIIDGTDKPTDLFANVHVCFFFFFFCGKIKRNQNSTIGIHARAIPLVGISTHCIFYHRKSNVPCNSLARSVIFNIYMYLLNPHDGELVYIYVFYHLKKKTFLYVVTLQRIILSCSRRKFTDSLYYSAQR